LAKGEKWGVKRGGGIPGEGGGEAGNSQKKDKIIEKENGTARKKSFLPGRKVHKKEFRFLQLLKRGQPATWGGEEKGTKNIQGEKRGNRETPPPERKVVL